MTPLLLAAVLLAQRADTLRYTILQAGNRAGVELAVTAPDGSLYFFEEYNDRGRGPRLETRVTLTPGGLLQTLSITGHDYWKQPVDERFTLRGDTAEWSSSLERDRQRLTALYSPFYGPVAGMALFIGAAGPGGEVALLPAGRARVSKVAERTVTAGEGGGDSPRPSRTTRSKGSHSRPPTSGSMRTIGCSRSWPARGSACCAKAGSRSVTRSRRRRTRWRSSATPRWPARWASIRAAPSCSGM